MKNNTSKILGVIPARYNSFRLPGKPLKLIGEKSMIQHVYEKACQSLQNVVVATDDKRILKCVESFKGNVVLTKNSHQNGTSRCLEALNNWSNKTKLEYDYVINIQGDEPLLHEDHLNKLIKCFDDSSTDFATVALEINSQNYPKKEKVFLVKDVNDYALYFSRNIIPYQKNYQIENAELKGKFYQHIGIYGYQKDTLKKFCSMNPSFLEKSENLEQLRWLENGGKIKVVVTNYLSHPVDTVDDLKNVRKIYEKKHQL